MEGLIWKEGKIVATVPLNPSPESGGPSGKHTPLTLGKHEISVRVDGLYGENELRSRVGFLVRQPEPRTFDPDLQRGTLREVAKLSEERTCVKSR